MIIIILMSGFYDVLLQYKAASRFLLINFTLQAGDESRQGLYNRRGI